MKEPVNYSKLWQQKRNELKLDADPDKGWADMQGLLNKHLPLTPQPPITARPWFLKPWPVAGFVIITVAVVYYFVQVAVNNKHSEHQDSITHQTRSAPAKRLSFNQDSRADVINNNIKINPDSMGKTAGQANLSTNISVPKTAKVNKAAKSGPGGITTANNANSNGSNRNASGTRTKPASSNPNSQNKSATGVNNNVISSKGKAAGRSVSLTNPTLATLTKRHHPPVRKNKSGYHINPAGKLSKSLQSNLISNVGNLTRDKKTGTNPKPDTGVSRSGSIPNASADQLNNTKKDTSVLLNHKNQNAGAALQQSSPVPGSGTIDNTKKSAVTMPDKTASKADKQTKKDKDKKVKNIRSGNKTPSNFDYGILLGVNSSGSFTAKSQNANIYGSFPVDIYAGLFGIYNFKNKWAVNLQVRALSPQSISGSYTHANGSKVDSGKILQVTDERKAYFVSIPVHLMYRVTKNLSFKAGPVINIPVKQISISSTLTPITIQKDTAYYKKITAQINAARYDQQINFGLSGGVSYQYKRLSIEATYLKNLTGFNVTSDFGNYRSNSGTFQFTIGVKLNRLKP